MSSKRFQVVKTQIEEKGWRLISQEYQNLDTELELQCPEGHKVFTSFKKFRTHPVCPICEANPFKEMSNKILTKKKETYRVLALDQSTYKTGYSFWDGDKLIKYGVFQTNLSDEAERILAVKMWLISMLYTWEPNLIAIEGIQFQDNDNKKKMGVTIFQMLARLQGVLINTCLEYGIRCEICPTPTWRNYSQVKGNHRADQKRSAQLIIKKSYDVSVTDDESDAILIGKYAAEVLGKNTIIENWEI